MGRQSQGRWVSFLCSALVVDVLVVHNGNDLSFFRYLFGSDVVSQFNQANDIDMICRAHQLVMEGYKWHFNETVLTVWSAPNYCYRCGNVAAILELDEHLQRDFTIFEAAPQESRGVPCKKPQADYFL
jgi:serine/threonine-protein phosphatase 4 catalytic subunit